VVLRASIENVFGRDYRASVSGVGRRLRLSHRALLPLFEFKNNHLLSQPLDGRIQSQKYFHPLQKNIAPFRLLVRLYQ